MHMKDFHDFENAILGNGETPTPAVVAFTVNWTAIGGVTHFDNPGQQYRGDMRAATAQMEWTARSGISSTRRHRWRHRRGGRAGRRGEQRFVLLTGSCWSE